TSVPKADQAAEGASAPGNEPRQEASPQSPAASSASVVPGTRGPTETGAKAPTGQPGSAVEAYQRGVKHLGNGDLDQAIAELDRAIELNPRYTDAYGKRYMACLIKGQQEKAFYDKQKLAWEFGMNTAGYMIALSVESLVQNNLPENAVLCSKRALQFDP